MVHFAPFVELRTHQKWSIWPESEKDVNFLSLKWILDKTFCILSQVVKIDEIFPVCRYVIENIYTPGIELHLETCRFQNPKSCAMAPKFYAGGPLSKKNNLDYLYIRQALIGLAVCYTDI